MNPLAQRSLLMNLHIKQWTGEVTDKKALQIVADSTKTSTKLDTYTKSLFVTDPLIMIKRIAGRIRLHFYRYSLPWADGGGRLMPSMQFQEFSVGHKKLVAEFEHEVTNFVKDYEELKDDAKANRGDLYNSSDYPLGIELYNRFKIELTTLPFPNIDDFRVKAPEEVIEELKEEMESSVKEVGDHLDNVVLDGIKSRVKFTLDSLLAGKKITQPSMDELAHSISFVSSLETVLPQSTRVIAAQIANEVTCYTAAQIRLSDSVTKKVIRSLKSVQ